jgi:hypothetical protein
LQKNGFSIFYGSKNYFEKKVVAKLFSHIDYSFVQLGDAKYDVENDFPVHIL